MESRVSVAKKTGLSVWFNSVSALVWAEFNGNALSFVFPLPFALGLFAYHRLRGTTALSLGADGAWVFVLAAFLVAMVYGLQGFSKEADRRTLDFTLSRPIPPPMVTGVKYLLSLGILLGWYALFLPLVDLDLTKLPLAKGMGSEWLLLFLLSVHGMGFFAGIMSRGLERLLMVSAVSGVISWLCYLVWQPAFNLMTANYYWFDIPPPINDFVCRGIPCLLMALSIALPIAGVLWHLHGRPKPWRFTPLREVTAAWLLTILLLLLAQAVFSPPLWPDRTAVSGDWRGNRVVLVEVGPASDKEVLLAGGRARRKESSRLKVATLWHRARTIYSGFNIVRPRFSPDGQWIAFVEDGLIKAIGLRDRRVVTLGPGQAMTWSHDSRRLILARRVGAKGLSRLYLAELGKGKPVPFVEGTFNLADLAWDSQRQELYLIGFFKDLSCMDLKTKKVRKLQFTKGDEPSIYLGVITPATALDAGNGRLYLGLINAYKLQVYAIDPGKDEIELVEERYDRRLQTGAPLLLQPTAKALVWPRIDGTFAYQSIFLEVVRGSGGSDRP